MPTTPREDGWDLLTSDCAGRILVSGGVVSLQRAATRPIRKLISLWATTRRASSARLTTVEPTSLQPSGGQTSSKMDARTGKLVSVLRMVGKCLNHHPAARRPFRILDAKALSDQTLDRLACG